MECMRLLYRKLCPWVGGMLLCLAPPVHAFTLNVALEEANNQPFEYLDEQGNLTGFHIELVRQICSRLGWQVRFLRVPWKRAQVWLADGHVQAVTYLGINLERVSYAWFLPDNVLHVQRVGLYVLRERVAAIRYQPPLFDMTKRWRFGVTQGYFYGEEINQLLKLEGRIDQSAITQAALLSMLLKNRIDVAVVIIDALGQAERTIPDIRERIKLVEGTHFTGVPVYIAFTHQQEGAKWAKQFAAEYKRWRLGPDYALLAERFHVVDSLPDFPPLGRPHTGQRPLPLGTSPH